MSRLAELGVAKRLSLIVACGVLALLALGLVASVGQDELVRQATVVRDLEAAADAVEATGLPSGPAAAFAALRPDVASFNTFATDFVRTAGTDRDTALRDI